MIGIISDIHGNYPALQAVLKNLEQCKKIIFLGDIVGYYCMPNECIEALRDYDVIALRGNHDNYLLHNIKCVRSNTVNECLDFQRKIITEENAKWLAKTALYYTDSCYMAFHGGFHDHLEEYIRTFQFSWVENFSQDMFMSGHTHCQMLVSDGHKMYLNPGSVGQPRDYNPEAAFAIVDDAGEVSLQRCAYDIEWIVREMKANGFHERVFNCLYRGTKIGEVRNEE